MGDREIATARLHLRAMRREDAAGYAELVGDARVRQYLGGPVKEADAFVQVAHWTGTPAQWVVTWAGAEDLLGVVQVSPHKDGRDLELSYQFKPQVWGHGVAFEACVAVLGLADAWRGNSRQVIAETQASNKRSLRLLQRLGFVKEAEVERFGARQVILARAIGGDDG